MKEALNEFTPEQQKKVLKQLTMDQMKALLDILPFDQQHVVRAEADRRLVGVPDRPLKVESHSLKFN